MSEEHRIAILKETNKELKETIKKINYQKKQLAKDLQVAVLRNNQKGDVMEYRVIELLQEIKSLLTEKPIKENWIGVQEASKYCGVSTATLRRNVNANKLSASTRTGKLLFKKSELENWLNG